MDQDLKMSTQNKQEEYAAFISNIKSYLKSKGLLESGFYDHYRLFGAQNLDSNKP
jgi:hypothetical protein